MKKITILAALCFILVLNNGCGKDSTGVFLFSVQDDIDLGAQIDGEIKSSGEYNLLDKATNPEAYAYLNTMRDQILAGGQLKFTDEFAWELSIIDDDATLNAFCTPGGYIYVYTGLIKYLDNSSSLAGVMGHEMAHADRRHSSKQLQQKYGISVLLSLLSSTTGNDNVALLGNIAASLSELAFSRADETDADEHSVKYLCPTDYDAEGAANFFEKIGTSSTPAFLSTHPAPEKRVENIRSNPDGDNCDINDVNPMINGVTYTQFKAML